MIGLIKDSRLTDQSNLVIRKSTPDGIEVIYAMAQLKGGDWTMVIQQEAADAFSDLKQTQRIVLLFIFDRRPWHCRSEPVSFKTAC
jgi:tRNA (Thr-GGU) A37 N-methylase